MKEGLKVIYYKNAKGVNIQIPKDFLVVITNPRSSKPKLGNSVFVKFKFETKSKLFDSHTNVKKT